MRRYLVLMVLMGVLLVPGMAFAQDDIQKHSSCKYCGMDRQKFAHSRVFVDYEGGTTDGYLQYSLCCH